LGSLKRKPEEALLPLEKLARAGLASKEALYSKGITLLELGKQEEAFEAFSELLEAYPDFKKAWYGKGLVLFSHEHYEEALEAFEQAVLDKQAVL